MLYIDMNFDKKNYFFYKNPTQLWKHNYLWIGSSKYIKLFKNFWHLFETRQKQKLSTLAFEHELLTLTRMLSKFHGHDFITMPVQMKHSVQEGHQRQ